MKLCARIPINFRSPLFTFIGIGIGYKYIFFFTLSMYKYDEPFNELHPNVFIHFVSVSYEL